MVFSEESKKHLASIDGILSRKSRMTLKGVAVIAGYCFALILLIYLLYDITCKYWYYDTVKLFIALGTVGIIRLGIKLTHIIRALAYKKVIFPRFKKQAGTAFSSIKELFVIVPTYMEKDWITHAVFRSISREARKVPIKVTVVVCTNDPGDRKHISETLKDYPLARNTKIRIIGQTSKGKRNALADSLRYIRTVVEHPEHALIAMMDGDAIWGEDLLVKTLPYFENNPRLGGVTTNEELISFGSEFYKNWFDYRLSMRDYYMSSHSFSKKVLCLTGRFSVIRGDIGVLDEFIDIVENDSMDHWLWGKVKFLGGDDKSTWFWIYKNGHRIGKNEFIYIPDALVYTIECINENGFLRAQKNLKRWFTNTARNNLRSLKVLPFIRTPFFIWFCILTQRLTMFTNLVGILTAFALGIFVNAIFIPAFLYLFLVNTFFMNMVLSINRSRTLYHGIYIRFVDQFIGTIVKLWAFSHVAQQKWVHRGGQKMDVSKGSWSNFMRLAYGKYEFAVKIVFIVFLVLFLTGILNPFYDIRLL